MLSPCTTTVDPLRNVSRDIVPGCQHPAQSSVLIHAEEPEAIAAISDEAPEHTMPRDQPRSARRPMLA